MSEPVLSFREERRYEHQIALEGIGREGQEKLKQTKILVVGAGGKGTSALKNLIAAGVGHIGICDDKLIKEESLCRQFLFGDNDIGKQKAIVSKQYLQARNQFTSIKVHNIKLTKENLHLFIDNYDLLIDATNEFDTHVSISNAAQKSKKPLILGTIINNKSLIRVYNGNGNNIIDDIFPKNQPTETKDPDIFTPTVVINSITGTFLANEAIKLALEYPSPLIDNMLIINVSDYSLTLQPV